MHDPLRNRAARAWWILPALATLPLGGCSTGDIFGNAAGVVAGGGRAGDIARAAVSGAADTQAQMQHALSPEQEYYLGRAVAASAIAAYGLDPDERRQDYVRKVGAAIVAISERLNSTYGGYHFAVLNTDAENGLSGPGGYVLITRGAMLRCRSEDELAGILCHELAHVRLKHGEAMVRQTPGWERHMGTIARVIGAAANADESAIQPNLTDLLGDSVADFMKAMAEQGYSKAFEFQADREGTLLLYDVGYDAGSIRAYLMAGEGRKEGTWDHHPAPEERIAALDAAAKEFGGGFDGGVGKAARDARWKAFLEGKPIAVPQTKEELQGKPAPEGGTSAPNEPAAVAPSTGSGPPAPVPSAPPPAALPEPPAGVPASPLPR